MTLDPYLIPRLVDLIEKEGVKLDDRHSFELCLSEAWNENRFKFLEKDGKTIGWVAWEPWACEDGTAVFVHSLFIMKQFKPFNLHLLVTFFREKYPDCFKIYWHDAKKDKRKNFMLPKREVVNV